MPEYKTESELAKSLKGLHLFHFVMSNCSQRVRLALEEKGLTWTSHHLDLSKNEHVTPEYQALNPKGVVPTLVHDGKVIVESNDILSYLEEQFPDPPLVPEDNSMAEVMADCMRLSGATQDAMKVITFDLLFRHFKTVSDDELEFLEKNRNNKDILQFTKDFKEDGDAWRERVTSANQIMSDTLTKLNSVLEKTPWLSGEEYGLADISWVVNAQRLIQIKYPFDNFPKLVDWCERAIARPAYKAAVENYRP